MPQNGTQGSRQERYGTGPVVSVPPIGFPEAGRTVWGGGKQFSVNFLIATESISTLIAVPPGFSKLRLHRNRSNKSSSSNCELCLGWSFSFPSSTGSTEERCLLFVQQRGRRKNCISSVCQLPVDANYPAHRRKILPQAFFQKGDQHV